MGRRFFQQLLNPRIKPLTLTAQEAGVVVMLEAPSGTYTHPPLKYRTNNAADWIAYTPEQEITLANKGDYVQFWNESSTFSINTNKFFNFSLTGSVAASGNTQSLLNYSETVPDYAFFCLFFGCRTLTASPDLPAETIGIYSYARMFYRCESLWAAPRLPAKTVFKRSYNQMFMNCINLQSLSVQLEEWNEKATEDWVTNIPASGTFYKPAVLTEEFGTSYIPEGWTVVNID